MTTDLLDDFEDVEVEVFKMRRKMKHPDAADGNGEVCQE